MSEFQLAGPILIVGLGSAGQRHFRNLKRLGCRDFVFLRSGRGTMSTPPDANAFPTASNLEEALRHQPAAAVIATPSSLHIDVALPLAEAGCDLYIEKPLCHELTDVARLSQIADGRGLVVMVGCQFRFHPHLVQVRDMIAEGRFGRVIGASAEYGEYLPDWHPWEDHRASYSARNDLGGGVLLTLIHPFDSLYWLFGRWERIQAQSARVPVLETPAGEDWCDVNIAFTSGVLGHVHVDYVQRPPVNHLAVVGDAGRVLCDFLAGELRVSLDGEVSITRVPEGYERNTMFLDAMRHFLASVRDRSEPRVPLRDGVDVVKIALEARQSAMGIHHD
jgi:predicted dehydrogenase